MNGKFMENVFIFTTTLVITGKNMDYIKGLKMISYLTLNVTNVTIQQQSEQISYCMCARITIKTQKCINVINVTIKIYIQIRSKNINAGIMMLVMELHVKYAESNINVENKLNIIFQETMTW